MRVRCARGTSCRYINAARVPVYSSSCQEGATNHKRWYTVDRLLFMSRGRYEASNAHVAIESTDLAFVSRRYICQWRSNSQWKLFNGDFSANHINIFNHSGLILISATAQISLYYITQKKRYYTCLKCTFTQCRIVE